MHSLSVCICTHNPDRGALERAIASVARQTVGALEVIVIDNLSEPALSEAVLAPLLNRAIPARLVREPKLGLSHARVRAIQEARGEWILFVDDDNELFPDYIENGIGFIDQHPSVGCFGGKLYLPESVQHHGWVKPYLPWLGVKDAGDETVINDSVDGWGIWEPPGAGSWVHREVLNEYMRRAETDRRGLNLGRRGHSGLASCDDSLLMRGAYKVGRANAYVPSLKLNHHLAERRFKLGYLLRLMKAYGESHMLLDVVLTGEPRDWGHPRRAIEFAKWLKDLFDRESKQHGWQYAAGQVVYHWSVRRSFQRLSSSRSKVKQ